VLSAFLYGQNTEMVNQSCRNPNTKSHFLFFFPFVCRGADSQAMDRDGRTALQYAINGGTSDEDILALLQDHSR
jgi:ankyrin repeat protein